MTTESVPVGVAYLKTFQALFQIIEFAVLLVTWSLIASQGFFLHLALSFAVGVFIFIWLLTIMFFFMYITGLHQRINNCCGRLGVRGSTVSTDTSTHGTPFDDEGEESNSTMSQRAIWYVGEYMVYLGMTIFLFISAIIVSAYARTSHFIAAAAFAWFALIVYILHFSLMVKNTEGVWPHTLIRACWGKMRNKDSSENEALLAPQPPHTPQPTHTPEPTHPPQPTHTPQPTTSSHP